MNLTLKEIEILLFACNRVGQDEEVIGSTFRSAKGKLNAERKRLLEFTNRSLFGDGHGIEGETGAGSENETGVKSMI
jgi:hypothetical protein